MQFNRFWLDSWISFNRINLTNLNHLPALNYLSRKNVWPLKLYLFLFALRLEENSNMQICELFAKWLALRSSKYHTLDRCLYCVVCVQVLSKPVLEVASTSSRVGKLSARWQSSQVDLFQEIKQLLSERSSQSYWRFCIKAQCLKVIDVSRSDINFTIVAVCNEAHSDNQMMSTWAADSI